MKIKRLIRHFLSLPKEGYHSVPDIYGRSSKKQADMRSNPIFFAAAEEARKNGRSLLYYDRLYTLYQSLENVARRLPKEQMVRILEVGVYKGGGSYFLASLAKTMAKGTVEQFAVDTFEGHSAKDLPQGKEGGHVPTQFNATGFEDVREYLSVFPSIKVLAGRIQDVVPQLGSREFDLIHLDVDIYEPTLFSLEQFGNSMQPGGIIVVDDYGFKTCPGVRKAVEEYIASNPSLFLRFELLTGQCLLVRV